MDETGQPGAAVPGENADGAGSHGDLAHPVDGWSDADAAWGGGDSATGPARLERPERPGWARPADPSATRGWADTLSRFGNRPVTLPAPVPVREMRRPVNGTHLDERTTAASSPPEPQVPVSAPPDTYGGDQEEGHQQRMIMPAPRPSGDRTPVGPASGPPHSGSGPVSGPPSGSETPPGFRPAPPYGPGAPEYEASAGHPTGAGGYPSQTGTRPSESGGYSPDSSGYPSESGSYSSESGDYQPRSTAYRPGRPFEPTPAGPYEPSGYEPSGYEPPGYPAPGYPPAGYRPAAGYETATGYEAAGGYETVGHDRPRPEADPSDGSDTERAGGASAVADPPHPGTGTGAGTAPTRTGSVRHGVPLDGRGDARGPESGRNAPAVSGGGEPTRSGGPTRIGARRAPERDAAAGRILRSVPDPNQRSDQRLDQRPAARPSGAGLAAEDGQTLGAGVSSGAADPTARDWSASWVPPWATDRSEAGGDPRRDDWSAPWSDRAAAESSPAQPAPAQPASPASPYRPYGYPPADEDPLGAPRAGDPSVTEALPQRVPAEPDVPIVPEPPAVEPPAETPELARIATHLRREDASPEIRDRPEGFDVTAILAAVRGVAGVRDATLRKTPAGAHSLRLDLSDGADPAEVSRQVARLLQERMGLAAAPPDLSGVTAGPAVAAPVVPAAPGTPSATGTPSVTGALAANGVSGAPASSTPTGPAAGLAGGPAGGRARPEPDWNRGSSGFAEIPPDVPRRRRRQAAVPRGRAPVEERPAEPATADVGTATPGLLGPSASSPQTAGTSYSGGQLTTTESAPSRPLNPGGPPGPRVVIDHVQVSTFGMDATVEVRLGAGEQDATGLASGPAVDGYVLRLCAVAAAAAIDELLRSSTQSPGRGRCFVEHAAVVPFGSCEVATVVVLLVCDGWVEQLAGSALVSGDPRQAVVRATLAAVNRRLEALLA